MAKRFTDTELWDKEWFMNLKPKLKCLVKYVRDKCNFAGIYEPNYTLASLYIGEKITESELLSIDDGKQFYKDSSGKIICTGFIKFQYGNELRYASPMHKKIVDYLEGNGFDKYIDIDVIYDGNAKPKSLRRRLSGKFKESIKLRDNNTCQFCGEPRNPDELVVDHFLPLSLGGGNTDENLFTSCISCNSEKSDLHPTIFFNEERIQILKNKSLNRVLRVLNTLQEEEEDKEEEEEKEKEKEKDGAKIEVLNPFGKDFSAWQGWKDYKREELREGYRSPKTESTALKHLYELARGNPETATAIIEQSIANRWKGLFEIKQNGNSKNKSTGFSREGIQDALSKRLAEIQSNGG